MYVPACNPGRRTQTAAAQSLLPLLHQEFADQLSDIAHAEESQYIHIIETYQYR